MRDIKIFACNTAEKFTEEVCNCLNLKMGEKDSYKFKNDNNFVQFKESVRNQDVYLNVVSGMKVSEPAVDLGIITCVASSFKNISIPKDIAFIGEVRSYRGN